MPIIFPPLTATGDEANLIVAGQSFSKRGELTPLALPSVRDFLGITAGGGGGTAVDDATNVLAIQVFGP